MPDGTPDYPSRDAVGSYLEDYATRFGLNDHIRLGSGVRSARRVEAGGWELELDGGDSERADALVVANGHNDGSGVAGPALPRRVRGRAAARPRLPRRRGAARQAGAGGRHGQQRDGHRHRHLARGRPHAAVGAPRQLGDPQAAVRAAGGPDDPPVGGRARALAPAPAARPVPGPGGRGPPAALRAPRPRARPVRGAPHDHRHRAEPDQPRGDRAQARHHRADRRRRALHRRHARGAGRHRVVHRLPRGAALPRPVARGARRPNAAPLQAHLPPRRAGPLLRRPHAVHGVGVPDPRAPGADPRRPSGGHLGPARP